MRATHRDIDMTIRLFVRPLWALRSSRPIKTTKRKANCGNSFTAG